MDEQSYFGITYYRLIQVDYDGTYAILNPIAINNDHYRTGIELSLYPNPTNAHNINIRVSSGDENTPMKLTIYDAIGHLTHIQWLQAAFGVSTQKIEANHKLKTGVYFVILVQGNNKHTKRLIIK